MLEKFFLGKTLEKFSSRENFLKKFFLIKFYVGKKFDKIFLGKFLIYFILFLRKKLGKFLCQKVFRKEKILDNIFFRKKISKNFAEKLFSTTFFENIFVRKSFPDYSFSRKTYLTPTIHLSIPLNPNKALIT